MQTQRCAIVGTAESWRRTPWTDPTLHIVGLNDAWVLGFPRVDEWWDLHPLDHMYFRDAKDRIVDARKVPDGFYVRPQGHIEKLREMAKTIPVWLQQEPPAGWPPNARRLPIEDLEAKYGAYWASGPAYELMHLYERGFREFQIFGIHLATSHERQQQRHNFEFLIGRLLGPQVTMTVQGDLRIYDGETGVRIVLPVESPILQHGWRYAFEPKPPKPVDPWDAEWTAIQKEKSELVKALVHWPAGKDRASALERLSRLEIAEIDITHMRQKRAVSATLAIALR